jgi:4-amino-4-deoxychorismate lyase
VSNASIWVNGQKQSTLALPDRGVDFGDGLFETILLQASRPLFLEKHLERLGRGLTALAFSVSDDSIRTCILRASEQTRGWAVLRVTLTRGGGARGYAPPDDPQPNIVVQTSPLDRDCALLSPATALVVSRVRLASQPALAGIKHLNRLEQVLAAAQVKAAGKHEGIMLDQSGAVISVIAGNLFLVLDGVLITPKLRDSGVAGTRRALVIENWAERAGVDLLERAVTLADISSAQEVFYTNALYGIRPIVEIDERTWSQWPVAERLFKCYLEDIQ